MQVGAVAVGTAGVEVEPVADCGDVAWAEVVHEAGYAGVGPEVAEGLEVGLDRPAEDQPPGRQLQVHPAKLPSRSAASDRIFAVRERELRPLTVNWGSRLGKTCHSRAAAGAP